MTPCRGLAAAVMLMLMLVVASPSVAQTVQPSEPAPGPKRPWELALGGQFITPVSLGTVDANLLDPSGAPLPLFRATTETGPGLGIEANIGTAVASRVDIEFTGAWTRFDVRTRISDDFEDVADTTVTDRLTRFSAGGAAIWRFAQGSRAAWFVRGGAAWMRELSSDSALAEDGLIFDAGVGVKYWLSTNAAGDGSFGLRAEFRVLYRRQGIEIDDGSMRLWPVAAGSAVFRF